MSGTRTTRSIVADQAILRELESASLTARELSNLMLLRAREQFAEDNGVGVDIVEGNPILRSFAHAQARKRGVLLMTWEIDARLRYLEGRGDAHRIQVPGRRPMLWRT